MDQRKTHVVDYGINVAAGISVAAVSWLAATLKADPLTSIPSWAIVAMAGVIGVVVVTGAAYINAVRVIGRFRWKPNPSKAVTLGVVESGAQQLLTMVIEKPEAGHTYRADLEKIS